MLISFHLDKFSVVGWQGGTVDLFSDTWGTSLLSSTVDVLVHNSTNNRLCCLPNLCQHLLFFDIWTVVTVIGIKVKHHLWSSSAFPWWLVNLSIFFICLSAVDSHSVKVSVHVFYPFFKWVVYFVVAEVLISS